MLWEPKMCRLAWQLLGMLGNALERPWHALQRPWHAWQRPSHACNVLGVLGMHFCKVLGVPHRRKPLPLAAFLQGPRTLRTLPSMPF